MTTVYGKTENSTPSKYKMAKDIGQFVLKAGPNAVLYG